MLLQDSVPYRKRPHQIHSANDGEACPAFHEASGLSWTSFSRSERFEDKDVFETALGAQDDTPPGAVCERQLAESAESRFSE